MGGWIIFGPNKSLRVAGGPIARLCTSAASDKRARPNADCLLNERKSSSSKPEKGSRGTWGPGGRRSVSVAISGNRKGGAGRPRAGRECWLIGLETTMADNDNPGDLTMLLS